MGLGAGGSGMLKLNKTPKDIWSGAELGGFWFQVFGVTKGDAKWPRRTDKGLALATKSGAMPETHASWGDWRIAQAEFYFDDKGAWSKLKEDCMWRMGWRARLRRFELGGLNVAGYGTDLVLSKMLDKLGEKLGDWLGGGSDGSLTSGALQFAFEKLGDELKKLIGDSSTIKSANEKIDNYILPNWEFVH
jgi:hypothetical protein